LKTSTDATSNRCSASTPPAARCSSSWAGRWTTDRRIAAGRRCGAGLLLLALGACDAPPADLSAEFSVFGSSLELQLRSTRPDRADRAIVEVGIAMQRLHRELHPWEPGPLTDLNAALANGTAAPVDGTLAELVLSGARLEQASRGYFNPAIGGLVRLWGFHTSDYPITLPPPAPVAIAAWLPPPSSTSLTLEDGWLSSTDTRVQLDFSGLAKGLAVREVCRILAAHDITRAMVNAGGDVAVCGADPRPWKIAIRAPAGGVYEVIEIDRPMAVFTSGNYHRYREFDGKRWSHLLDPSTGQPVAEIVQATVIDADPLKADAAATALVVAGPLHWREVAASMGVSQAIVIDASGRAHRFERGSVEY
jgi:thiamine biosynthesis lipoprotein